MKEPLVTVFTTVYNCSNYIRKTIESILNQSYTNFEYIIIDDGSTDDTVAIIQSYDDKRIQHHVNKTNQGISKNRNAGIQLAKGKYIATIDADDLMKPSKLLKQVSFMEANPNFGIIGTYVNNIDSNDKIIGNEIHFPLPFEEVPSRLLFNNYLCTSSTFIRLEALKGLKFEKEYVVAEDYKLWIKIVRDWKIGFIREVLTQYRVHDSSISQQRKQLMIQCDHKILQLQLDELDAKLNKEEYEMMFDLGKSNTQQHSNNIGVVTSGLNKLFEANSKTLVFDSKSLKSLLLRYWRPIFIEQKTYTPQIFKEIKRSVFFKALSLVEKIKLILKCFIYFNR